jgi:hypothetical protein
MTDTIPVSPKTYVDIGELQERLEPRYKEYIATPRNVPINIAPMKPE